MWPRTELIDLLKIRHPIIQAPMASASTPKLVAAVSNTGGLGSYGRAATPPAKLRQIIRQIRELTDQPFAVNLFAPAVEAYHLTPEQQTPMSELFTFAVPYEHGLIGTVALVPQIADAVSVPVVAAGGIMDIRGIAAAFAFESKVGVIKTNFENKFEINMTLNLQPKGEQDEQQFCKRSKHETRSCVI